MPRLPLKHVHLLRRAQRVVLVLVLVLGVVVPLPSPRTAPPTALQALLRDPPRHIIVSELSRLVFCPVPKAANSNWKYLIRRWERVPDFANLSLAHHPRTSGLRYLADYSPAEAASILADPAYFRFVFVRHPFERLLSCYMDKFQNRDPDYVTHEYRAFLAHAFGWPVARDADVYADPRPTFQQFVRAVAAQTEPQMNAHWIPQTTYCAIGVLPYDFVGRMENLTTDVQFVFRRLRRHAERFPTQTDIGFPPSGASSHLAHRMYDSRLREIVRAIYQRDFRLLGYT